MKKHSQLIVGLALAMVVLLSACGANTPAVDNTPSATAIPAIINTNTPDPCAPENMEAEVQKIHNYMREFDDASSLAASRPREQLADAIADLQRIRREAEDQFTPHCLGDLKTYQVSHMNSVINTLIAFMGGSEQQLVDQGIALAREQHDQYTLELARLLGLTIEPATVVPLTTATPAP
ncbi:MAG: hypothetical protein EHM33_10915 [Chloroflexi bacterium]|nr:MAG: hypothetical protein EHM33_10915 [Chloroflexota bacterium]